MMHVLMFTKSTWIIMILLCFIIGLSNECPFWNFQSKFLLPVHHCTYCTVDNYTANCKIGYGAFTFVSIFQVFLKIEYLLDLMICNFCGCILSNDFICYEVVILMDFGNLRTGMDVYHQNVTWVAITLSLSVIFWPLNSLKNDKNDSSFLDIKK